ncbi:LADA_0F08394g1_1 [Lachancea dasiensis]|uniref:RNA-binding protein VTS1 n=1 Tax=Lachancea dasiensis TaxID=1072105 RepID=A0A1G4JKP6_9SACH|nr:LADA_0F08394g1_1 [Lachancea dasiensis]
MFQQESMGFPTRVHSPVSMPRRAHPGAVLLTPQSSSMANSHSGAGENGNHSQHLPLSPQLSSQHLSLNDLLDQQQQQQQQHQTMLVDSQRTAAGPAVVSPLLQPSSSMFLDSFSRPASSMAALQTSVPAPPPTNMVNFTHDLNQLCSWMSMLSSAQQNSVMDNLLSSLNEEVLQNTKLKLDSLVSSGYMSPSVRSPQVLAPIPDRGPTPQPLTLDSLLNNNIGHSMNRQWSPISQNHSNSQPIYDYINDLSNRPRSADPQLRKKFGTPGKPPQKKSSPQSKFHPTNGMSSPTGSTGSSASSSMNPKTLTDPKLLNNIPAWLKSLRLHKYSDALNGKPWTELIYLGDDSLEALGVSALGARRKLLKAFAVVRDHRERGLIDSGAC